MTFAEKTGRAAGQSMVRIVITTVNRPRMLRQALQSVLDQTARDRISEVLVSENGGSQESRQICAEFSSLPIRYVFRVPAVSAFEHGRIIFSEPVDDAYTAILHDDDWWLPEHLEKGLLALDRRLAAAACYASFYEWSDGTGLMASGSWHFYWWFGAGFPQLEPVWELDLPQMAAASYLRTVGHYSSLIARSGALKKALDQVYASKNPYDNDRMLTVLLAMQGAVLYQPLADVVVRLHAGQDARSFEWGKAALRMVKTTEWITETCKANGVDLAAVVAGRIVKCPAEAREQLNTPLSFPWCVPLGRQVKVRFPETVALVPDEWRPVWQLKIKAFVRQLLPPLVVRILKAGKDH